MVMITVILLLMNTISGCFNIVKYILAEVEKDYSKKTSAAIIGALNWTAVFVLVLTLIRQVG